MHKLAMWAAKEQHLRTVIVIEEDVALPKNDADRNPISNHTALHEYINSGSWDVFRCCYMPFDFLDGDRCKRLYLCLRTI